MRRFMWKTLWLLPLGILMVGVNLWVDPAGLFHQDQEKQIAAYLLEGYNVADVQNHDERQGLRYYVEGLKESKDVLVFGSSRAMVIDSAFFPGESLFNASVAAATLRDVVANYQLFYEKGLIPRKIVVGVEPYMLNRNFNNKLYLRREYLRALDRLDVPVTDSMPFFSSIIDRRYGQVLSPSYFQVAVRDVPRLIRQGRRAPYTTTEFETPDKMVRADGSLSYGSRRLMRDDAQVTLKARRFVARNPEELANFRELAPDLCRVFERFVDSLLDEGVEVVFLLAPYHPIAYEMLMASERYRCVGKAQTYFEDYAAEHGIAVYGSYDPGVCGLTGEDFNDAVHSSREALLRIFRTGRRDV